MKIKHFIPFAFIILISFNSFNQVDRAHFCSHDEDNYKRMAIDPAFKKSMDSIEKIQLLNEQNYIANNVSRAGTILYIPVVYHIIHEGGVENISDAQVHSDIAELNRLYRKQNSNVGNVKSYFLSRVADVEIEFRLAQKKPDGTCFSGITRTFSAETNTGRNDAMNAVKLAQGNFSGNKYMNILVAKSIGGAAGYTYRPGYPYFADMNNGIHVLHNYVGNIGTSTQTGINTTIAHEAGHWLNLPHLWGSSNSPGLSTNCSIDDGISDTPLTIGWQYCNTNGVTCSSLDNVENIMEYSYCSKMFTNGQKTKMRAALNSYIGGRNNLITSANHTATGIFSDIICEADLNSDKIIVCQGEQVKYSNASYHNATSWSWTFDAGSPRNSTQENPIITYNTPGLHTVFLTASNSNGSKTVTKTRYIKVLPKWGVKPNHSDGFEGSQANFEDDWTATSTGKNNWELSTTNYAGAKSAKLGNYYNTKGAISELYSKSFDLTGSQSVSLSYKYAYARKSTTVGETVQLLISKNCGASWLTAKTLYPTTSTKNSNFVPNNSQWASQSININAGYFKSNFMFKFKVKNSNGNNVYIDDVNISRTVGTQEIESLANLEIYPNPMSQSATISLDIVNQSIVSVGIFNVIGEKVSVLLNERQLSEGSHDFNLQKGNLRTGIYFVKVTVNGKSKLKKLIIH